MSTNPYLSHLRNKRTNASRCSDPRFERDFKRKRIQIQEEKHKESHFEETTKTSLGSQDQLSSSTEKQPSRQEKLQQEQNEKTHEKLLKLESGFIYGNYSNYYGIRHHGIDTIDPRLSILGEGFFKGKRVLDIGCNAGRLTIDIASKYNASYVEGVDLDPSLIEKAKMSVTNLASTKKNSDLHYFPISCFLNYGPRKMIHKRHSHKELTEDKAEDYENDHEQHDVLDKQIHINEFPNNIHFRCCEWLTDPINHEESFEIILLLSVSKWIHLHHGDQGIKQFFEKCYQKLSKNGGILVLEPQPWSSYGKKINRSSSLYSNYKSISFKPDMFIDYLLKTVGFEQLELKGFCALKDESQHEKSNRGFNNRNILLFVKK